MPKSKEYLSSDDDSHSNSSEEEKPKKKKQKNDSESKKSKSSKDGHSSNKSSSSKDEEKWDLGNMREVNVREFKGKLYVDIREMYMDKDSGDIKPGRKGISLSIPQFKKLMGYMEEIDKAVQAKA